MTSAAPARSRSGAGSVEAKFFRTLNRIVVPPIRHGFSSPAPAGLIVLETVGRKSGRRYSVPLAAMKVPGHVVVATFRGRRSQWVQNVAAQPRVRFWLHGRPKWADATVLPAGRAHRRVPKGLGWLTPALTTYRHAGWAFAILTPAKRTATRKASPRTRKAPAGSKRKKVPAATARAV